MIRKNILFDVHWDVEKYKNKYGDFWTLCRAFMMAHKTKYREPRLVSLTDAFYKMGTQEMRYDPKTTRIVHTLAVEILENVQENGQLEKLIKQEITVSSEEDSPLDDSFEDRETPLSEEVKLMKQEDLKELLEGFVIFCGVTKESTLKNQLDSLNESFARSRFKKCSWKITKYAGDPKLMEVSLSVNNIKLAQSLGNDEVTVRKKIAQALLKRISKFAPTIQANWSYYRDGRLSSTSMPNANSPSVFKIVNDTYLKDNGMILNFIDNFAELSPNFKETMFVNVGDLQKKMIIQHVEGKWFSKLTYRKGVFTNEQDQTVNIVCVYPILTSDNLLQLIKLHGLHEQYSIVQPTNPDLFEEIDMTEEVVENVHSTKISHHQQDFEVSTSTDEDYRDRRKNEKERSINDNHDEGRGYDPQFSKSKTQSLRRDDRMSTDNEEECEMDARDGTRKECSDSDIKQALRGFVMFYDTTRSSEVDKCDSLASLNKVFQRLNLAPLEDHRNMFNGLWKCRLVWNNQTLAVGEHQIGTRATTNAVLHLLSRLETFAYCIETKEDYLCNGEVPGFILNPDPMKSDTYRLVYREDLMNLDSILLAINEFRAESTLAELIFGPDFSWDVKKQIIKHVKSCDLEYRYFSANTEPHPTHLAIYHPVDLLWLKDYLMKNGGENDKYKLIPPSNLTPKDMEVNQNPPRSTHNNTRGSEYERGGTKEDCRGRNFRKNNESTKRYSKESPERSEIKSANRKNKYEEREVTLVSSTDDSNRKRSERISLEGYESPLPDEPQTPDRKRTERNYETENESLPPVKRSERIYRRRKSSDEEDNSIPDKTERKRTERIYREKKSRSSENKGERQYQRRSKKKNSEETEISSPVIERCERKSYSENKNTSSPERKKRKKEVKLPELVLWIGIKDNSTLQKNLFSILENSLTLAKDRLDVERSHFIEKGLKFHEVVIKSQTKVLGKGCSELNSDARALAACDAFRRLRKECYAIQPLDSYFKKGKDLPPPSSNIEYVKRSEFYSFSTFINFISDELSHDSKEYIFGPDFTNEERKSLVRFCQRNRSLNCRLIEKQKEGSSSEKNKEVLSYVVVWKELSPQEWKEKLMKCGGKSDKYLLVPPGGKMAPQDSDIDFWPETLDTEVEISTPTTAAEKVSDKKSSDFWLPRKAFEKYADSLVMCQLVRQDSTTETDPTILLESSCSLSDDVEFVYTPLPSASHSRVKKVVLTMKCQDEHVLMGEGVSLEEDNAALIATKQAVHTIQSVCRVIQPNPDYFADGKVPSFIASRKVIKTDTYEIVTMENMMKDPLDRNLIEKILNIFMDSKIEDLFFLVTEFTNRERTLVTQVAEKFNLRWRLFGPRAPKAIASDVVSSQHVCVYKPRTPQEIVRQVISKGGATDKYLLFKCGKRITTDEEATGDELKKDYKVVSQTKEDHLCLNDCPKYYKSTCPKGHDCPLRHEPNAKGSRIVCALWKKSRCYDKKCIKRHMEVDVSLKSTVWEEPEEDESEDVDETSNHPVHPISVVVLPNSKVTKKLQSAVTVVTKNSGTNIEVSRERRPSDKSCTPLSNQLTSTVKTKPSSPIPSLISSHPTVPNPAITHNQYTNAGFVNAVHSAVNVPFPSIVSNANNPQVHNSGHQSFPSFGSSPVPIPPEASHPVPKLDATRQDNFDKSLKDHFTFHGIVPVVSSSLAPYIKCSKDPFSNKNEPPLSRQFSSKVNQNSTSTLNHPVPHHAPAVAPRPPTFDRSAHNLPPCRSEPKMGGCYDKTCKYMHTNILDVIVNRYLP